MTNLMSTKKTLPISNPRDAKIKRGRSLAERVSISATPAQREMVHLNVKFIDEMASIWNDTVDILEPATASELIKEAVRLRAYFAWYSQENIPIELKIGGEIVDLYKTLGLKHAVGHIHEVRGGEEVRAS